MPEWIGQTIGKVRIDKYLARGGMAEVYLGTHLTLDRPVAVKVLHSYIETDPDLLSRFQREAKAVAGLRHPNIVQVFDFDTHDGHPYIVMEYLKGPALSTYLRHLHDTKLKLSFEQIGHLLKSLVSGIDYAHAQGIVHRDIKPANILLHNKSGEFSEQSPLSKDAEPIITDFGLARLTHSSTQTASGFVSGTPAYMSPEQARGDKVDHRADIYSLGIVLYEMLAGRVPFEGDSSLVVIYKHIHEPPPAIENISPQLQSVIDKALTKDPNLRYQSGSDLARNFFEAIGMHTEAQTIHSAQTQSSRPATEPNKRKTGPSPVWIGAGIFVCACIGFLTLSALGLTAASIFPWTKTAQNAPAGANTTAGGYNTNAGDTSVGVLRFQDGTSALDQITISAALSAPAKATQYQAWLIADSSEVRKNLGILTPNTSGQFILTFVDPQSRNLLAGFNRMQITVESNPDNNPNPSETVAYSSEIPSGALIHIRHLLVMFDTTPNHIGMAAGLVNTSTFIKDSADVMLKAYQSGDTKTMFINAEAIVNLITGKQDPNHYKDWDGNGKISDPGDGYGLLLNGDQAGFIGGTMDHAELSAKASDSTPEIRMHSEHVVICAKNVEGWATQLRDIAIRILQTHSNSNLNADVRSANTLANKILNGIDIDGNESVDPISGEGGAITAYNHADYMSDMPILAGENQIPAPGHK
jgi:serine/threonine protein kinase